MLALTLALAAAPTAATPSVIDAERAFAKLAQDKGQWTAFRATAAPEALLFWPSPKNAHEVLKGLKDPAKAVRWWPTKAWQSCDGSLAVTTGGAAWPDGHFSQFTTVWKRQPDGGWKWVYDNGADVKAAPPQPMSPQIVTVPCGKKVADEIFVNVVDVRSGQSADKSLIWTWSKYLSNPAELKVRAGAQDAPVHTQSYP